MQVQVELKKGETILTDASLHLPAACLHEAFSHRSGVPPDHFELYYRGKRLEGETALASWGVEKDATIEVKMRGRGGGCVGAKEASSVKEAAIAAAAAQSATGSAAEALQAVMGSSADSASTERAAAIEKATAAEKIAAEKEVGKKAAGDEAVTYYQEAPSSSEAHATEITVAVESQSAQGLDLNLRFDVVHGLEAHDFTDLWHEKLGAHLAGTREWAFTEIFAWLDAAPSDAATQLFWLMGGGGVGKSVLTAELLHRAYRSNRVVAWHFCRHDNPQQSSPDALLRSLAAMLCARLPGYEEALGEASVELLEATDTKELFAALFTAPLQKVKSPEKPSLIILDALDELPKQGQKPLLNVIAAQLSTLPKWLRLFVTSREEPQIKAALEEFEPKELRADEANNRADVEVR